MKKDSKKFEKVVSKSWDENADLWANQLREGYDIFRDHFNNPNFFKLIGDLKDKKVLDAGCGEGYNTRLLAKKGAKVFGVDISKRMIELAEQEELQQPLGISYKLASLTDLSFFQDESFDIVVSFMALMDCSDYQGAIKEFFRVLGKNGDLFFCIHHPCFLTKGHEWLLNEEGRKNELIICNYFDDEPWIWKWKFSHAKDEDIEPFKDPCFPKILSEYLNILIEQGFIIKKITEPRPSQELCDKFPIYQKWRNSAAPFLHVHTAKL